MTFSSALADRVTAVVLFAVGLSMLIGGYTMERLEFRDIHPASIPGLVPMILGATMMLCAGLLFAGARDDPVTEAGGAVTEEPGSRSWRNLLFAAGYSVVYALGLVGNMPFWVATSIFIAVFVVHFTHDPAQDRRKQAMKMLLAIVYAVICAASVSLLFRYGFLVRLP